MITPEIKDRVLSDLVAFENMRCATDIKTDCAGYGITCGEYSAIIDQLEKMGFIACSRCLGGYVEIRVSADAHDFYNRGGFVGQEMLLKANIEKLGFELDKLAKDLTPDNLATAEKIASIGSAIISAIGYFH